MTSSCTCKKKADYCLMELNQTYTLNELHRHNVAHETGEKIDPMDFAEWLRQRFKGKIISIYINDDE